jgi:starvation-inducible DNA-binding protein
MNNLIDAYKVYLASNFALYLKTHGCHFNVTGMFFQPLHKLFEEQYEDLWKAHDAIGENIRKLDMFTPAGLAEYAKFSLIDDSEGVLSDRDYIDRLFMDHERMIILIYKVFEFAEAKKLQDHMNFLAERLDKHGKHRWMLKTMLHAVE